MRDRSHYVVRSVVQSGPDIPDVSAFLSQRLADVDAGDLTGVGIPATTAGEIVAALSALLAQSKGPDLALSDLLLEGAH